jgi:integrase
MAKRPRADRLTVDDLLDALEENYKARGKYNAPFATGLKKLREKFGQRRAVDIQSEHLDAYVTEMVGEEYSPASVNRRTQILGQAFRMAVKKGKLARVPAITKLNETGNVRSGFFSRAEVDRLLTVLPEYLRDAVLFAFKTSWRRGEVFSLAWADVEWSAAGEPTRVKLREEHSNEREPRALPIDDDAELCELVKRRYAKRRGPLLFHHAGKPIAEFRKAWATATKRAGLKGRLFHDLRRSGVREMILSGVPQAIAMSISGHKTDAMFRRYCITNDDAKREALRRVRDRQEQERAELARRAEEQAARQQLATVPVPVAVQ